ncbi:pyridoxine 5'-phosphate synthase [Candidatus Termititenax dinenymphae]|uniref:Pyridoxine 5'-phosphate synthase n=1 Tax=Candidatus Termititenax dinenymphae TaxID=2218523 RepID=A0A388TLH2_9BACT|nr:pyridoxine 5'-phosphate synthase [Candidatus Termititenax dinenymphae]
MHLGVNIDHIATLRQARQDVYPDLLSAAGECIKAGADGITIHLREDRRHIQDSDVSTLRKKYPKTHLNLEMAAVDSIAKIAVRIKPDAVCIVPEKRQELTTEGGLDVKGNIKKITSISRKIQRAGVKVSLFIDPDIEQIKAAALAGTDMVELHTGTYGEVSDPLRPHYNKAQADKELQKLLIAAKLAKSLGLQVNAGHGLTYQNVKPLARHKELFSEFNIGHNIIARAIFVGLKQAVQEMNNVVR